MAFIECKKISDIGCIGAETLEVKMEDGKKYKISKRVLKELIGTNHLHIIDNADKHDEYWEADERDRKNGYLVPIRNEWGVCL